MANGNVGDLRLTQSQYLRPGAYIGYIFQARPVSSSGLPRLPGYVGRGSRLAQTLNFQIIRSYIREKQLSFSLVAPHVAPLTSPASPDKTIASLYTQAGLTLRTNVWQFSESEPGSGVYDQIEIAITDFDVNATYYLDYQSTDRTVDDEIAIDEIRQMLEVGEAEGSDEYIENVDYRIVTEILGDVSGGNADALIRDENNSDGDGQTGVITATLQGGSTGSITPNPASKYTFEYSMSYNLQCIASGGIAPARFATFQISIDPLSGGNDQVAPVPKHPSSNEVFQFTINELVNDTNYRIDANYPFTDEIALNFSWGGANFVGNVVPANADLFDWDALGPQLIEISSAHDNTNQFSEVTEPAENGNIGGGANTTSGDITLNTNTNYDNSFDRHYYMEVISVGVGPRTATIAWRGWDEMPYTYGTLNLDESNPSSLTNISLEEDIYLDFDFGVEHLLADVGDLLVSPDATDLTSAVTLATEIGVNWNRHDNDTLVAAHNIGSTGNHQITAAVPVDEATLKLFCQDAETVYSDHIGDSAMHPSIDTVWLLDSSITLDSLVNYIAFLNDFKVKNNRHVIGVNFVAGDTWLMTANAAMQYYTAKDNREYTLTTTTVTPGTSVEFQWRGDTYESSWGNKTPTVTDPYMEFTDNITLALRNFDPSGTLTNYDSGDIFTFTTVNDNEIDWTLRQRVTQSFASGDIYFDSLGRRTGTPGAYYVILDDTPETINRVEDAVTGNALSYSIVTDTGGNNLPYIMFITNPNTTVEVTYEHRGSEPDPGLVYFVSVNRLRSDDEYNTPTLYLTRDLLNEGLRPSETTNHIWIMGNIAFDTGFFGCYITQVKSASEDEIYTIADYRRAIDATETVDDMTDLVVLSQYEALGYAKSSVEKMSNPFIGRERLLWQGAMANTPIGDSKTPDTLIYLSTRTLQPSSGTITSPSRGRCILTGNTWAKRTVTLDDGTSTQLDLDGSFIAGYGAARTAAFAAPYDSLLRKDCASFDDMETFNSKESILVGNASILYLDSVGSGLFRYNESVTVDQGAPDVHEISAMTQKDYVTRRIRSKLDLNLVGIVPPSPAAGVIQIQSYLVGELANIVSEGFVAPYGSEENPPTIRPISADEDTQVFVDERDRRRYHLKYWYNIIYPIKWILGLYSVDSRFWDNRSLASAQ